jgi:CheY-like chemotaxis protein
MQEDSTARSILVAEDNGDLRAWLREVLENEGYAVMEAANGREVMDVLRRASVDLCITDLAMPEQEGIETIRLIRYEYPELKIITISGAFGPHILRVSRILGAAASLRKPIDAATLLNTVRDVLATSNLQVPQP